MKPFKEAWAKLFSTANKTKIATQNSDVVAAYSNFIANSESINLNNKLFETSNLFEKPNEALLSETPQNVAFTIAFRMHQRKHEHSNNSDILSSLKVLKNVKPDRYKEVAEILIALHESKKVDLQNVYRALDVVDQQQTLAVKR